LLPGISRSFGLKLDNPRRPVNQFLPSEQRRGETASGKRRRGAVLGLQPGIDPKQGEAEVSKLRPVAELETERGVKALDQKWGQA